MAGRMPQPWHLKRALANPPWLPFTDIMASGKSRQAQPWKALSPTGECQSPTGSVPALVALPSCLCSSQLLRPKEVASFRTIRGSDMACSFKAQQPHTSLPTPPSSLPPYHHHGARLPPKINWLSARESKDCQKPVLQDNIWSQRRIRSLEGNANRTDGRACRASRR